MLTRECARRVIHPSLVRPVLFGGAEQGMTVLTVIAAVGIPLYGGFHVITITVALLLAFPLHALGVGLAKKDPQMVALYVRSLTARDFYLPFGARKTLSSVVRPSIPGVR